MRAALSGRTGELERLAVELYARGLSTRDIKDTFTDETGRRLLSRAAVSEITEKLWAEYEDFCKRDLSEHAVAYLFIDGIAKRLRPGQRREAVLAAWGIGEDGRKSLLGLMAGSKEDVETVRAFFQDLRARGLGDPLLTPILFERDASRSNPRNGAGAHSRFGHKAMIGSDHRVLGITPTSCPVRSPVSRTISRPASPTCACRSRIVVSQGRRTSSNGCSSRSGGG